MKRRAKRIEAPRHAIQGTTTQRKLRSNLRRIAGLLDRLAPDIVALQEIDERSRWAGNFDHLDYLRVHAQFLQEHGFRNVPPAALTPEVEAELKALGYIGGQ